MSNNANRNISPAQRRQNLRLEAELADYGLDGSMSLGAIADEAHMDTLQMNRLYECRITGEEYAKPDGTTIDWRHFSALTVEAVAESGFTDLPWNLTNMVNAGVAPGSYPRFASRAGAEKVVRKVQRFCGWLKAAADLPAISRVIDKTQSSRGMWSPRTTLHLWDFAERHPSPGKLERKLWAVRNRAESILSAYAGEKKPAWWAIARALEVTEQVGKAAVIAVASTISGKSFRMYREARGWLVDYHLCKVEDDSDGVISRREEKPQLVKLGIGVFRTAIPRINRNGHQIGVEFQFLVRSANGRTYHSNWGGPAEALHNAIRAWKEQDKLAMMDAESIGFLKGEMGFCPLVVRQDSYSAGNCSAGTESWLRKCGWADREFIPAIWLIPHLDYGLVRNVAMSMYRRYTEQK